MEEVATRSQIYFYQFMKISHLEQRVVADELLKGIPYMMYEYFMKAKILPGRPSYNRFREEDLESAKEGEGENEYDSVVAGSKDMFYITI